MREIRQSGSEGGGGSASPYPYPATAVPAVSCRNSYGPCHGDGRVRPGHDELAMVPTKLE
jgi:hypothetical protein